MRNIKKLLVAILVIVLVAAGFGFYSYNKKPADIRTTSANYQLTAAALLEEFNKDETVANQKYVDKVLSVQGRVSEVKLDADGQATVILDCGDPMAAITCSFYENEAGSLKNINVGTEITIKGKCTGKLMDVVLNKCSIENKEF